MDEYIDELLAEFEALTAVVKNILDEPIPEAIKKRLLKPLGPSVFKRMNTSQVEEEKPHLPLTKEELTFFEDAPLQAKLDPDLYYGLAVDNVPVLYPDGSYVKRGNTIVRREIRADVDGRPFALRPVARGPDITDDGEVYWVSFENEDLRVTKAIGELVLELLDPDEQYKLFTVMGKAAKEPLAPIIEEEGASDHRIKGKTVVRGDQVSASALHGIDPTDLGKR